MNVLSHCALMHFNLHSKNGQGNRVDPNASWFCAPVRGLKPKQVFPRTSAEDFRLDIVGVNEIMNSKRKMFRFHSGLRLQKNGKMTVNHLMHTLRSVFALCWHASDAKL